MSREVRTIKSNATIYEAALTMARFGIGSLVVINDDQLVGILTEGDVSRSVAKNMNPNTTLVLEAMSKPLTIGLSTKATELAIVMWMKCKKFM